MAVAAPPQFHVLIIGGSISGLTLANLLSAGGISYTLLESHASVTPTAGGSLALFPQGCRVLDQLGLYERFQQVCSPISTVRNRDASGHPFFVTNLPQRLVERFGYPMAGVGRKEVLEVLYSGLRGEKGMGSVVTGKKVVRIDDGVEGDRVKVHCADGSEFIGDLVVGCDGVHSAVRKEMWRLSAGLASDRTALTSDHACLFGISALPSPGSPPSPLSTFTQGENNLTYHGTHNIVTLTIDRNLYWASSHPVPATQAPHIPRYTPADMDHTVATVLSSAQVTPAVTFADIWAARTSATMVALEEGVLSSWHSGRIALVGDAVHKMTPEMGQGANAAIESAAVLANELVRLLATTTANAKSSSKSGGIGRQQLAQALQRYQNARKKRCVDICESSAFATRLQCGEGLAMRVLARWGVPWLGPVAWRMIAKSVAESAIVNFLPVPRRAVEAGGWPDAPPQRRGGMWKKERGGAGAGAGWMVIMVILAVVMLAAVVVLGVGVGWVPFHGTPLHGMTGEWRMGERMTLEGVVRAVGVLRGLK
ncbi:hypothetical protein EDC01DRAFT_764793 [Geopyxis carbonaria]|nr:hypothetical protein EDC01DRAFT_764793 [Geopyxis carbonaria]